MALCRLMIALAGSLKLVAFASTALQFFQQTPTRKTGGRRHPELLWHLASFSSCPKYLLLNRHVP